MKYIIHFLLFTIVCVSCSDEVTPSFADGNPILFTTSISGEEDEAESAGSLSAATRGWHAMDSIGIYMYPSSGTISNSTAANKLYYSPATATYVSLLPGSTSETIYYPKNTSEKVRFTAYYPYKSAISNNIYPIDLANQSSQLKHIRADLLWHQGTTDYNTSSSSVKLAFAHQLSKVTICLVPSSTQPDIDLSGATASFAKLPYKANFSLSTGVLSDLVSGASIPINAYCKSASVGEATFEAIVIPHTGSTYTGRTINFTVGENSYVYELPNSYDFTKGNHYTFNLMLDDSSDVVLTGVTITNWTDGGTISPNLPGSSLKAPTEVIHYKTASTDNTIVITTRHSTSPYLVTPGIEYSTSATSIVNSATVQAYLTQKSFVQTQTSLPYEWTLTYDMAAYSNTTSSNRVGYIHVSVGTMKVVIKVTQTLETAPVIMGTEANCYLLPPGGRELLIPISRAKYYSTYHQTAHPVIETGETFYTEVYWSEYTANKGSSGIASEVVHPASIIQKIEAVGTGPNGFIRVISGSLCGNAVVTLKKKVGTAYQILWSWHVWVTDYNPSAQNTYLTNSSGVTTILMDRNLGAESANPADGTATYGLLYQWGKKDPLPGTRNSLFPSSEPYVSRCTNSTTVAQCSSYVRTLISSYLSDGNQSLVTASLADPFKFYIRTVTPWDWSSVAVSVSHPQRWQSSVKKAIDDPCPAGWHVPVDGTWNGINEGTNLFPWCDGDPAYGRIHANGTAGYYPAGGYRLYTNGSITGVSGGGAYWTASQNATTTHSAYRMYLTPTVVNFISDGMALGLSVRCAQYN